MHLDINEDENESEEEHDENGNEDEDENVDEDADRDEDGNGNEDEHGKLRSSCDQARWLVAINDSGLERQTMRKIQRTLEMDDIVHRHRQSLSKFTPRGKDVLRPLGGCKNVRL